MHYHTHIQYLVLRAPQAYQSRIPKGVPSIAHCATPVNTRPGNKVTGCTIITESQTINTHGVPAISAKPLITPPAYFVTNPTTNPPSAYDTCSSITYHIYCRNRALTLVRTGINVYISHPFSISVISPPASSVEDLQKTNRCERRVDPDCTVYLTSKSSIHFFRR